MMGNLSELPLPLSGARRTKPAALGPAALGVLTYGSAFPLDSLS